MIDKHSGREISYSIVDVGKIRHVFLVAAARSGESIGEQTRDALERIRAMIGNDCAAGAIVSQTVFIDNPGKIPACRGIINRFYGDEIPATTYVSQPPCGGASLAIEAHCVGGGSDLPHVERRSENLVITRHDGVAWVHCGQVCPAIDSQSVYDRAKDAFARMRVLLSSARIGFDHIVRTWFYLGDILGAENERRRYEELNRARGDFFRPFRFGHERLSSPMAEAVYPASTGIGASGRDLTMSCVALETRREDVKLAALENPRQTAAFDYDATYGRESPKFSRAMAIRIGRTDTVLVSGTASIVASESRFAGDVEAQTHQTLDNIAELISAENFRSHGLPGGGQTLSDLATARVYVKRREDYDKVKRICESRLGELPTVYAEADICRDELLVEIEGMGFSAVR